MYYGEECRHCRGRVCGEREVESGGGGDGKEVGGDEGKGGAGDQEQEGAVDGRAGKVQSRLGS